MFGNWVEPEPWEDPDGTMFIGNELRNCRYVGFHLGWVGEPPPYGCGPVHIITGWGDEQTSGPLDDNPAMVYVTDSDAQAGDPGNDVQDYIYDDYDDPLPPERGPGWYLNDYLLYGTPLHPFLMNVVMLGTSEVHHPNYQTATGSETLTQPGPGLATGLHYVACTDTEIIDYQTTIYIDGYTANCTVDEPDSYHIVVDCTFDAPLPVGTVVRITTEFTEFQYNSVFHSDMYFTYDKDQLRDARPAVAWQVDTPYLSDTESAYPGLRSGYVVGAYELYADAGGTLLLGEVRFAHEYDNNQDPEHHDVYLRAHADNLETCYVHNLRCAHCTTPPSTADLWLVTSWDWTDDGPPHELAPGAEVDVPVEWPPDVLVPLTWSLETPADPDPSGTCRTGGYVYGGFALYEDAGGTSPIGEYRLQQRYTAQQNPESHTFQIELAPGAPAVYVDSLRFGHTYGKLSAAELSVFELSDDQDWLTAPMDLIELSDINPLVVTVDWAGQLPFPKTACYAAGDCDCNGTVNFNDIDPFVAALVGAGTYYNSYPDCWHLAADCNYDGAVNFDDIDAFVAILVTLR